MSSKISCSKRNATQVAVEVEAILVKGEAEMNSSQAEVKMRKKSFGLLSFVSMLVLSLTAGHTAFAKEVSLHRYDESKKESVKLERGSDSDRNFGKEKLNFEDSSKTNADDFMKHFTSKHEFI